MNTNTHTVTLPIADYQELMAAHSQAEAKYESLKNGLIDLLRRQSFRTHNHMTLEEVINAIKDA